MSPDKSVQLRSDMCGKYPRNKHPRSVVLRGSHIVATEASFHRCHLSSCSYSATAAVSDRWSADSQPVELSAALTKAMTQFGGRTLSLHPPSFFSVPISVLVNARKFSGVGKEERPECGTAVEPLSIVVVVPIRLPPLHSSCSCASAQPGTSGRPT